MPGIAAPVPCEAGDLGLMHRVDHGGRGASAAEHIADIDHVTDAGAFAPKFPRNRNPHQALGAQRCYRFSREAGVTVDSDCVFRRDRSDLLGALGEACEGSGRELGAHRRT